METAAIIPVAGKGQRMGTQISKQFLMLNDKPIMIHTIEIFAQIKQITKIILVTSEDEANYCQNLIDKYNLSDIKLVFGGENRQDSVYNGLRSCGSQTDFVIIHDGVRPLVEEKLIVHVLRNAYRYGSCSAAVPVKDTIKIVDDNEYVINTPKRDKLWAAQTPQAFQYDLVIDAHEKARIAGFIGTDDASLVERFGGKVKLVKGSYENIKITTPIDLKFAELILERNIKT
ncbi:MAG TPA: 2-C-methyl-D-erythritol 4-phosphate cytidylyltransferase [Thermoanaerobacterales bacterium]|nr:2-C-methyl-D-erythritol 4-phosphate cytidylyltransferase [Thermoanaerobacterales bacterium]